MRARALRVHVLVDLQWNAAAGGHVKVWERLAETAHELDDDALDLTVHVSGPRPATHELGERVRFRVHPPVFSTTRLPFLSHVPDHTDLAPHHRGLAEAIAGADVLHTTDAYFAFARTAERIARRHRIPLVNSVHTDTPRYTRIYTAATITRLLGGSVGRRLGGLSRLAEAHMERRLLAHQRLCAHALVARPSERTRLTSVLPASRVGLLRRGIDHHRFSPSRRDRGWLEARFGVPPHRLIVLLVGRLELGKNVGVVASAVRALRDEGLPLHLLCAGEGLERAAVTARLPTAATCVGLLDADTLAKVYASADLFALPSLIDESSNALREALAAGLPVAASQRANGLLDDGQTGLVVPTGDVGAWAQALGRLGRDAELRAALGRRAHDWAARALPSWTDVLAQDLLPVWRRAAGRAS